MHEWDTDEYRAARDEAFAAIRKKYPDLVTHYFECWAGWYPIVDRYFDEVAAILVEHPGSTYELFQVKEKFASLCLYADTSADIRPLVSAAYAKAREEAKSTCDVCGKPGRLLQIGGYWYATRCAEHADGGEPTSWNEGKTGWPRKT
jgi:hypothetical protein